VIYLDGHIEATRPHQRTSCSKGEEGYVVPSGLGVRREDGSAVGQVGGGNLRLCQVGGGGGISVEVWR
jgi:hypothetical protein